MTTVFLPTTMWGNGPRRALLLHGIASNADLWWRLGPHIAEHGYTVTAPDLRGHGQAPDADDHRLEQHRDDVLALGTGWDLVLGHSLGGVIAVMAATAEPDWTKQLILEDPALVGGEPDEVLQWLLEPFSKPLTVEQVSSDNPGWHPEDARRKAIALEQCGPSVVERIVRHNGSWNLVAETVAVTIPTLLVLAEEGTTVPPVLAAKLEPGEHLTMTTIPGSTHSIHRDSFDAFAAAIEPWL